MGEGSAGRRAGDLSGKPEQPGLGVWSTAGARRGRSSAWAEFAESCGYQDIEADLAALDAKGKPLRRTRVGKSRQGWLHKQQDGTEVRWVKGGRGKSGKNTVSIQRGKTRQSDAGFGRRIRGSTAVRRKKPNHLPHHTF